MRCGQHFQCAGEMVFFYSLNMNKPRVFSGVQPSGNLHIGNYLGAIKQFALLQHTHDAFFCIVDEHAITIPQKPEVLLANTMDIATLYLAADIDPKIATIFVQSHVPAHTELGWILNTMTPIGELERMTQFKEKSQKQKDGIYAGLFNYPTLMAADILLYEADFVPVGEDQFQHLELTRSLAERFNNRFGKTFVIPRALTQKETGRIMALDDPTKKMSKSAENAASSIALMDAPDLIRKKIQSAVTDSESSIKYDEAAKPAIANLLNIYSAFADLSIVEIEQKYADKGYANFKRDLGDLLVEKLEPLQHAYHILAKDRDAVLSILHDGAEKANTIARATLNDVKRKMGFL